MKIKLILYYFVLFSNSIDSCFVMCTCSGYCYLCCLSLPSIKLPLVSWTNFVLIFVNHRLSVFFCRIIQATHCNNSEPCVCYVAKDLSSQGLLNDPETCDRPCSVRLSKSSPDDDDCYQCKSKYDFWLRLSICIIKILFSTGTIG